jgi:protein-L-isoaspartate(D-aspartate) O-methyltransferase
MLMRTTLLLLTLVGTGAEPATERQSDRERMVRAIEADVRATSLEIGRRHLDPAVMTAMREVPRHRFVPASVSSRAYENRPLPIGFGQTISQPYIVALMTDLLALTERSKVLEIGTGSGYQAAVLAHLGHQVLSIEIIPQLAEAAASLHEQLGYAVEARTGDGYYGWPEEAPFGAIIVTAAASHVPPPLLEQLAPGGIMVLPVGGPFAVQQLTLVEKGQDGRVTMRQVLPVAFVPLTGDR